MAIQNTKSFQEFIESQKYQRIKKRYRTNDGAFLNIVAVNPNMPIIRLI